MGFAPMSRPKPPARPPVEVLEVSKLHAALCGNEATPNVLTLDQFRHFAPLFRKDTRLTAQQLKSLGDQYCQTIDLYKKTVIVKNLSDKTPILTLPPILTPVRSLPPSPETGQLVDTNTKMAGHDVPRYSSMAFAALIKALLEEQTNNSPVIAEYRRAYIDIQKSFSQAYATAKTTVAATPSPVPETSAPEILSQTTWSFED